MFASGLITFRETLEAALVVGIVLSFLTRTGQKPLRQWIWYGVAAGIGASILGAVLFHVLAGGFEGRSEQIFECVTMWIGAGLLSTMIFWMMKRKPSASAIETAAKQQVGGSQGWGIFLLIFVAVLREGIETVIFLNAARYMAEGHVLTGALIGVVIALLVGVVFFYGSLRLPLGVLFRVSTILLILFAAGLVAYGTHEFQEAGFVPIIKEHLWDVNPALLADGSFPMFHEKGSVGGMFKGLFGYNGNPSLIEICMWAAYLVTAGLAWRMSTVKPETQHAR